MKAEDITVAICTYRRNRLLTDCLTALTSQTVSGFTIMVIDNDCNQDCAIIAKKFNARYYEEPIIGLSSARNKAIQETKNAILLFLDDDAIPDNNLIIATLSSFEKEDVDIVGGMYFHHFESRPPNWLKAIYSSPQRAVLEDGLTKIKPGEYLSAGILAFRRKTFEDIGGFNHELGMKATSFGYGEEDEIQDRARNRGLALHFNSDMKMSHLVAPRKHLLANQLKMAYSHGAAWNSLSVSHPFSLKDLIKKVLEIIFITTPKSIVKIFVRKNYYWQNAVIDTIGKTANAWGKYRGIDVSSLSD